MMTAGADMFGCGVASLRPSCILRAELQIILAPAEKLVVAAAATALARGSAEEEILAPENKVCSGQAGGTAWLS